MQDPTALSSIYMAKKTAVINGDAEVQTAGANARVCSS
jgi:hypothetical protein